MLKQVKLTNCIENVTIFQGLAKVESTKNGRLIHMNMESGHMKIKVYDSALMIESVFDANVKIVLRPGHESVCMVDTEVGRLKLACAIEYIKEQINGIEFRYRLEDQIYHFYLEEEEHAVN